MYDEDQDGRAIVMNTDFVVLDEIIDSGERAEEYLFEFREATEFKFD